MYMKKFFNSILSAVMILTAATNAMAAPNQTDVNSLSNTRHTFVNGTNSSSLEKIKIIAESNKKSLFMEFDENQTDSLEKLLYHNFDADKDNELAQKIKELNLKEPRERKKILSYSQALSDLTFLIQYLKYGYAGYEYFGGDAVFYPIHKKINIELNTLGNNTGDKIEIDKFVEILVKHLSPVILDGHFVIDNKRFYDLNAQKYYYTTDSVFFQKDDTGFFTYTVHGNEKCYLKMISNESIDGLIKTGMNNQIAQSIRNRKFDEFLKPTLDEDGELAYVPGFTSSRSEEMIGINLIFSDNRTESLTLKPVGQGDYLKNNTHTVYYNRYEKDGVKIIESRSFYPVGDESSVRDLEKFAEDAKALRDEKALIIDLRGNNGGFADYSTEWIGHFADIDFDEIDSLGASNTLLSETVYESYPESYGSWYYEWYDAYKNGGHTLPRFDTYVGYNPEKIENDTLIFVITDAESKSASEYFLAHLSLLDNVTIVGTNTAGMFTFGSVRPIYLPNSGINIFCGFNMFFLPDLQTREYVGFQPDLWVDPNESIEKVLKLIANNNKGLPSK